MGRLWNKDSDPVDVDWFRHGRGGLEMDLEAGDEAPEAPTSRAWKCLGSNWASDVQAWAPDPVAQVGAFHSHHEDSRVAIRAMSRKQGASLHSAVTAAPNTGLPRRKLPRVRLLF